MCVCVCVCVCVCTVCVMTASTMRRFLLESKWGGLCQRWFVQHRAHPPPGCASLPCGSTSVPNSATFTCCSASVQVVPQSAGHCGSHPEVKYQRQIICGQTSPWREVCVMEVTVLPQNHLQRLSVSGRKLHISAVDCVRQTPYSNFGHKRKPSSRWSYFYSLFLTTLFMGFFGLNG